MPEIDLTDAASRPKGVPKAFSTPDEGPEVLLVRHAGAVHTFAAHCPHYGAPLAKGRLVNGNLVCSWYHACFRAANGSLCEPPALDGLPAFAVREAGGRVPVQVPEKPAASSDNPSATPTAEAGGAPPTDAPGAPADARTFVLVGGRPVRGPLARGAATRPHGGPQHAGPARGLCRRPVLLDAAVRQEPALRRPRRKEG